MSWDGDPEPHAHRSAPPALTLVAGGWALGDLPAHSFSLLLGLPRGGDVRAKSHRGVWVILRPVSTSGGLPRLDSVLARSIGHQSLRTACAWPRIDTGRRGVCICPSCGLCVRSGEPWRGGAGGRGGKEMEGGVGGQSWRRTQGSGRSRGESHGHPAPPGGSTSWVPGTILHVHVLPSSHPHPQPHPHPTSL